MVLYFLSQLGEGSTGKIKLSKTNSIFWLSILAHFWQAEEEFFYTTVISLFHENSSNKFYIRPCVQTFNLLFCLYFKRLFKYTFFWHLFKIIYRSHWGICGWNCQWWALKTVKLPMTAVQNIQISNTQQLSSFENIMSIKNFL